MSLLLTLLTSDDALIEDQDSDDEDIGFLDDPGHWIMDSIFGPIMEGYEDLSRDIMDVIFASPVVETDNAFTFGRPEDTSITGVFDTNLLPHIFAEVYDYTWLGEGGIISVMAIIFLLVGISIRGMFDMIDYKGNTRSPEEHSYITGFFWIVLWYPLFLGLINITHAIMQSFGSDAGLGFGLSGAITATFVQAIAAGPFTKVVLGIAFLPWVILAIIMFVRAVVLGGLGLIGPILIAGKHSNLPFISRACGQILSKSIAVVFFPLPIAPIMFVIGNFILGSIGSGLAAISGAIFMCILGCTLLFAVWSTFKIISPQLAGSAGMLGNVATAGAVVATGGTGAVASAAVRGGPAAAAARVAGNKWGGNNGSRKGGR